MTQVSRRSFARLERQKQALLSEVSSWPAAGLRFRTDPACWSALDVLDHLWKVEKGFLAAVQSNLPEGHSVLLKDRVGGFLVTWVMRSPMRVKVPASAQSVFPETGTDPSAIAASWSEVRVEIAALLEVLSAYQLRCGLFQHPVSGWMTMPQGLAFLAAHVRHHEYQLNRLKVASYRAATS